MGLGLMAMKLEDQMSAKWIVAIACSIVLFLGVAPADAQQVDLEEFFESRIRPILANNCHACHADSQLGGLRLDSRESILKGGKSGPAVVPGRPEESLLIRAVKHLDPQLKMPMGGQLKDGEIESLVEWVKAGAPWPENKQVLPATVTDRKSIDSGRQSFWSFQPIQKTALPRVRDASWPRRPIDYFVLAELEKHGLKPVAQADKRTLIRRATFDLIGLPPTPEQLNAFLEDDSPEAFAKVVDGLLASPQYGVRWARYWLDVARYGEDDVRGSVEPPKPVYPNAWRYRDWVIGAFNDDMPYDLFVKAQIAGDLLPGDHKKYLAGLGFFGLGPWYYDTAAPPEGRANERNDRVDALTRGFLGLTVACARCHNHKYDPITIEDYYGLAGVFASTEYGEIPLVSEEVVAEYKQQQTKIKDAENELKEFVESQSKQLGAILAAQTSAYVRAAWEVLRLPKANPEQIASTQDLDLETLQRWVKYLSNPQQDHPYLEDWNTLLVRGGTPEDVARIADQLQSTILSLLAENKEIEEENRVLMAQANPEKKKFGVEDESRLLPNRFSTLADYCVGCEVAVKSMLRDRFVFWRDLFSPPTRLGDNTWANDRVFYYGDGAIDRFLDGQWKKHLEALRSKVDALKKAAPPPYPYLHAIADLGSPRNLKVHLRGSPYNFGEEVPRRFLEVLSVPDAEPLLDGSGRLDLAGTIADHPLATRVIVNRIWQHHFGTGIVRTPSNFGQVGDRPSHPELLEYLAARFLESNRSLKALHREMMLSATYQLSADPSPESSSLDAENRYYWQANRRRLDFEAIRDSLLFVAGNLDPTIGGPSAELTEDNNRRTVFGKVSRVRINNMLSLFDFPDPSSSSERRNVTNVPLQRLFFMNSDFVATQAESLADRIRKKCGNDNRRRIEEAYRLLYSREATEPEIDLGLEFLKGREPEAGWWQYAQVLLGSNELIFVN